MNYRIQIENWIRRHIRRAKRAISTGVGRSAACFAAEARKQARKAIGYPGAFSPAFRMAECIQRRASAAARLVPTGASRYAPIFGTILVAAVAWSVAGDGPFRPDQAVLGLVRGETKPGNATRELNPSEARAALTKHLDQYLKETEGMLDLRVSRLKAFFEERKEGARPFASSVLSIEAKLRVTGAIGEVLLGGVNELFGGAAPQTGPDSFTLYVRRRFQEDVLDQAKVIGAIDQIMSGFLADMTESEGRLLVALKADLDENALNLPASPPDLRAEMAAAESYDALIDETVNAAVGDLAIGLCTFVVSSVIGDKVAGQITPAETSRGGKLAANIATGMAVDAAIDQGVRAMGYDPEANVVAKTAAGIDRVSATIIDGDPNALRFYPGLSQFRRMHPDQAVRDACKIADEAVERTANLGLRVRLTRLRNERYRRLWTALIGQLCGTEAASSPLLMYTPLDPTQTSAPDEIIRWADSINSAYGGAPR